MGQLFGTDGIRGVANQYPITCDVAIKTGQAMGLFCQKNSKTAVVIGKDTRISGDMLEAAIAAGAASTGVTVFLAGVIPTPGVAYLCADMESIGAGIVISASHNPYEDNGIKIFKHGGVKLSDAEEQEIENFILTPSVDNRLAGQVGRILPMPDSTERYADFLVKKFSVTEQARALNIVVDCSNGAAFKVAPVVFQTAGLNALFIHCQPDGKNINHECGSQYTQDLAVQVRQTKSDIGLAFDGDADRLIAIDETGNQISGDQILAICAQFACERKTLEPRMLVSTIMSNIGLTIALEAMGIAHEKADVGDRKVLEAMIATGAIIGGEDSGHMLFLTDHTTGDGLLSALKLLEVVLATGKPLSELARVMTVYPQVLMNVTVGSDRPDVMKNREVADTIMDVEQQLGDRGRVLIRYSGTQPLLRVMVEGPDQLLVESCCKRICSAVETHL